MKLVISSLAAVALVTLAGCNTQPAAENEANIADIANDAAPVGDNAADAATDKPADGAAPATDAAAPAGDKPVEDAAPVEAGSDKPVE